MSLRPRGLGCRVQPLNHTRPKFWSLETLLKNPETHSLETELVRVVQVDFGRARVHTCRRIKHT